MQQNLSAALDLIRTHEGGYVNHPRDPGGPTNLGITLATYRAHGHPGATITDLKSMPWAAAAAIYRATYWAAVRGDGLPDGVDLCVFDCAVNSGPARAARLLNGALGLAPEDTVTATTLARAAAQDPEALVIDYCAARLTWLRGLKTWRTFGRGWTRRVRGTQQAALDLLAGRAPHI